MEIDFHKFENYLIKKDKKNPDYRPLTSLPYNRPRNMSALESIQNQQLPRKSPQIGYTLRMHPNERSIPHLTQGPRTTGGQIQCTTPSSSKTRPSSSR